MGRIAKELGVSPMPLYRYVGAKDELYVLMWEAAVGVPPEGLPSGAGWRECLAWWARAQRAVLMSRPRAWTHAAAPPSGTSYANCPPKAPRSS
jgi:hypothetical protein